MKIAAQKVKCSVNTDIISYWLNESRMLKISGGGGGAGSEVWNRVYMIAPSETENKFSLKTNTAENADMEGQHSLTSVERPSYLRSDFVNV